ncbi:MAG: hypothetical protein KF881_01920 [Acidobacteria bacterium]|nr:hypothetical protein [Acidobacteriota bacterium]
MQETSTSNENTALSPEELESRKRWFDGYVDSLRTHSTVRPVIADVKYSCPCCRNKTLNERGGFEICQVCFWEDDGQDDADADVVRGGPNREISLTEARANYKKIGACDPRSVKYVRKPRPDEVASVRVEVRHKVHDLAVQVFGGAVWAGADVIHVETYWSGESVPIGRRFDVRMLWSDENFYVRFDCEQSEPLTASTEPVLDRKVMQLWDRDVCELFLAPDRNEPRRYFEFEVAPTGEWLDLAIDLTSGERVTDWDYHSGMEAAAKIEDGRVLMAMKIPWEAFGRKPKAGDVWLGNIFRCVGEGESRGYLAWQPTMTERPNFHVPEAFGEFVFC